MKTSAVRDEIEKDELIFEPIEPGWTEDEFNEINLNDSRLDNRFKSVAEMLSSKPTAAPINQACKDWAATKAAYRLFDNEKVEPQKILWPHQKKARERMNGQETVLVIHDTTYVVFENHTKAKGLGKISSAGGKDTMGLVMHNSLAVTPQGLPLGLLEQQITAREEQEKSTPSERANRPIEEKESFRWLTSLQSANAWVPEGVGAVHVCDREADMYVFFIEAEMLSTKYLVRAHQNRAVVNEDNENCKLWEFASNLPVAGKMKVKVPARPGARSRTAEVEVRFSSTTVNPPKIRGNHSRKGLKPIDVHIVYVSEPNAPEGVEPLDWLLMTNTAVNCYDDALERISWYRRRWDIEVYHKVLKSGCRIEARRLETAERLERCLTLCSVIAWRIFWMTKINRTNPDAECTEVLADHEWKALFCSIHRTTEIPIKLPTVREVVRWIAGLGGFLGRKRDGEPGNITVWRGWQRLTDISSAWLLFRRI